MPALERRSLSAPNSRSSSAVCQAMPIAEVAGEFAEITGYATVMFAITLVVSVLLICPALFTIVTSARQHA